MKRTLLIIATVISTILLANCSDSPNTPTIPTEIEENENVNTEHLTHLDSVKDEADAPPPERIIDVDEIVGSNNIELDRILGKPIEVIQSNPIRTYASFI